MDWFQDALYLMKNSNGFFQFSSLMMSVKEEGCTYSRRIKHDLSYPLPYQ